MARLGFVQVSIRAATTADVPAMVAIKHDAGVSAWPHILPAEVLESLPFPDRWANAIDEPDPCVGVLIAESAGRVVGFAVIRPSGDPDADASTGELDGFYADPAQWGVGVGRALLAAATRALREVGFSRATLWTAEENHRPRRIYEVAGWQLDGWDRRRALGGVEFVELRYVLNFDSAADRSEQVCGLRKRPGGSGKVSARTAGRPSRGLHRIGRRSHSTGSPALSHHDKSEAKKPASKKPAAKPAAKKSAPKKK
jgi:GNAT superfamily N-acetyltransferase